MAPIPSRAEITQATLIMRSHFAAVSVQDHLSAHARRLVSFLANGYCAYVHLAWQYGGSFEGIA